ncbi:MAG: PPK2 family polyphosphate kinase [Dialister sp.]
MEEIKHGRIDVDRYRVKPGEKVHLKKFSTKRDVEMDKAEVKEQLFPEIMETLKEYQEALYAENKHGLIIVLQAMDAAGKDGTINHVFSHLNPGGITVSSFKEPSTEEQDHDYLWRINKGLPPRGNIGIFNRSHYEDVIVTRIHDLIKNSQMPDQLINKNIWKTRFEQINHWEKYLYQNGFPMIKIFLHVSKEEQQERLIDRIITKEKNWKFSISDINEREYWDRYQELYEEIFEKTSTEESPWYIVPADNKWYTRYVVSLITRNILQKINPKYPELSEELKKHLEKFKKMIAKKEGISLEEIKEEIKKEEHES